MSDDFDFSMDSDGMGASMDFDQGSDFEIDFEIDTSFTPDLSDWEADAWYDSWSNQENVDDSQDEDTEAEIEYSFGKETDVELSKEGTAASFGYDHYPDRKDRSDEEDDRRPHPDGGGHFNDYDSDEDDKYRKPKRRQTFWQWLFGINPDDEED